MMAAPPETLGQHTTATSPQCTHPQHTRWACLGCLASFPAASLAVARVTHHANTPAKVWAWCHCDGMAIGSLGPMWQSPTTTTPHTPVKGPIAGWHGHPPATSPTTTMGQGPYQRPCQAVARMPGSCPRFEPPWHTHQSTHPLHTTHPRPVQLQNEAARGVGSTPNQPGGTRGTLGPWATQWPRSSGPLWGISVHMVVFFG
jgi:hypothetical protein